MLNIALANPEIPPNTGNIIRLAANMGARLHLIHPLAFALDDKKMRRAGLDYHEFTSIIHYESMADFVLQNKDRRVFACTTKAQKLYTDFSYQDEDIFLFGPETKGLSAEIRKKFPAIKIPMIATSRSLNLSNSVAIILFEAWRQLGFK